ncbi:MAG: hypothetical protein WC506_05675 [Candidatus Micrarchaeia archaeon]
MLKPENIEVEIWKEEELFIIRALHHNITTQGKTLKEALVNFNEAFILYIGDDDVQKQLAAEKRVENMTITIPSSVINYEPSATPFWPGTNKAPC